MKHIAGWFRRNNTIMAQAKDLSRQLTEAWYEIEMEKAIGVELVAENVSVLTQLHRVARERDQERKKRIEAEMLAMEFVREKCLAAEDALIDYHLDKPSEEEIATIENYKLDNILAELDNEEE